MSFLGGSLPSGKAQSKQEVLRRAKEARSARANQGQTAANHAASLVITRLLRRHRARRQLARRLEAEWAVPETPPARCEALVSLVDRYLAISRHAASNAHAAAAHDADDDPRLRALTLCLLASMDGAKGAAEGGASAGARCAYTAAALSPTHADRWRAQLRPLLGACLRAVECAARAQRRARAAGAPAPSAATAEAARTFGPPVRLCLVLTDARTWSAAPAADATRAELAAFAEAQLSSLASSGALARALGALAGLFESGPLSAPVLTGALSLGVRPLRAERAEPPRAAACAHFARHLLAVPALVDRAAAELPAALWARVHGACCAALAGAYAAPAGSAAGAGPAALELDGPSALGLVGNALALATRAASSAPPAPPPAVAPSLPHALARAARHGLQTLRSAQPADGGGGGPGGSQAYHPLLGWVSSSLDLGSACRAHAHAIERQISGLSAAPTVSWLFGSSLAASLTGEAGARAEEEASAPAVALPEDAVELYLHALAALPARRAELLSALAYPTLLLSRLWARALGPRLREARGAGGGAGALWSSLLGSALGGGSGPGASGPTLRALELFARAMAVLLPTLEDSELESAALADDGTRRRFCTAELGAIVRALNPLAWECVCAAPAGGGGASGLTQPLLELLRELRERHERQPICSDTAWLVGARAQQLGAEALAGSAPALGALCQMPWALPFERRVEIFRALVRADKLRVRGGDGSAERPRTAPELLIVVRRAELLQDGYAQLARQPRGALRHVLRVKFVSALGTAEAGIDHNGVFKEFMEETTRAAFDANLGLFASTADGLLYASPHAAALHPQHEALFEFVGRILGKALYEGVTLDVPLAPFFVRRALGGANSLDELPQLDAQLHSSLLCVKGYAGDVEADLCLSFAIDVDELGARRQVELKPGGAAVPVDNANRIQYVHLVADYHLNKQVSSQARALHRGLVDCLQPGWLRLFSAPEAVRLLVGDDVEIDVDDLRRHTRYHGGYHDLSPTVRHLWQVLAEFDAAERKAFLKFVTACSRPPLLGFANLEPPFAIQCVAAGGEARSALSGVLTLVGLTPAERERLPTAATCFNLLKLPDFRSKKLLRDKLRTAIHSNSGFELS